MWDRELIAISGFVALFGLMLVRVPVGLAMALVGVTGYAAIRGWWPALNLLTTSPWRTVTEHSLSVVPMFILMGTVASVSGMSRELFEASQKFFGHRRGGLAVSTIFACGGFSAINGSSIATVATMTKVALPEMRRAGYDSGLAAGTIAAGATLGVIIPPSVIMVIYAVLTEVDLARLFIAGIVPGMLAIALYVLLIKFLAYRNPEAFPLSERASFAERMKSLKDIWAVAALFLFVIYSIYSGIVTITEAAAFGAVGAIIISFLRGRLTPSTLIQCLVESLRTTASIFTIAIGAFLFGYFLTITQTTQTLTTFIVELPYPPYAILLLVVLVLLVMGAIMDELPVLILTIPILFPAMMSLGFDPIWFGLVIVMTTTLGMTMPPVGMNVFVLHSISSDIGLGRIYRGVAPFIVIDMVRLFIICAFPALVLFLPNSM